MAWFGGRKSYDRSRILEAARRAERRRAHTKAIALYERVREVEPKNTDVLRRLAVQRARAGQRAEATRDCLAVTERLAKRGFVDQAIGLCREIAARIPDEAALWHRLADLELERGRRPDAVGILVEGARRFPRRRRREALTLLRRAHETDRTHFEAGFALGCLMARCGAGGHALGVLESMAPHARTRRQRRRLRGRLFRLSPGPATAWRWLVAALGGGG